MNFHSNLVAPLDTTQHPHPGLHGLEHWLCKVHTLWWNCFSATIFISYTQTWTVGHQSNLLTWRRMREPPTAVAAAFPIFMARYPEIHPQAAPTPSCFPAGAFDISLTNFLMVSLASSVISELKKMITIQGLHFDRFNLLFYSNILIDYLGFIQ